MPNDNDPNSTPRAGGPVRMITLATFLVLIVVAGLLLWTGVVNGG